MDHWQILSSVLSCPEGGLQYPEGALTKDGAFFCIFAIGTEMLSQDNDL